MAMAGSALEQQVLAIAQAMEEQVVWCQCLTYPGVRIRLPASAYRSSWRQNSSRIGRLFACCVSSPIPMFWQVDRQLEAKQAELEEMDDDDAIEAIRARRIAEMKEQTKKRQEWSGHMPFLAPYGSLAAWRCAGHGEYSELSEKEFFDAVKKSERMVVHFYRPSTWRSKILDKHFVPLAQAHQAQQRVPRPGHCPSSTPTAIATSQETRFVMINVEKAHFLVEKLNVRILPSVVLINGNHTQHTRPARPDSHPESLHAWRLRLRSHIQTCPPLNRHRHSCRVPIGFDELGGNDDFSLTTLEECLEGHGVIFPS
eukprot:gene2020-476_t